MKTEKLQLGVVVEDLDRAIARAEKLFTAMVDVRNDAGFLLELLQRIA